MNMVRTDPKDGETYCITPPKEDAGYMMRMAYLIRCQTHLKAEVVEKIYKYVQNNTKEFSVKQLREEFRYTPIHDVYSEDGDGLPLMKPSGTGWGYEEKDTPKKSILKEKNPFSELSKPSAGSTKFSGLSSTYQDLYSKRQYKDPNEVVAHVVTQSGGSRGTTRQPKILSNYSQDLKGLVIDSYGDDIYQEDLISFDNDRDLYEEAVKHPSYQNLKRVTEIPKAQVVLKMKPKQKKEDTLRPDYIEQKLIDDSAMDPGDIDPAIQGMYKIGAVAACALGHTLGRYMKPLKTVDKVDQRYLRKGLSPFGGMRLSQFDVNFNGLTAASILGDTFMRTKFANEVERNQVAKELLQWVMNSPNSGDDTKEVCYVTIGEMKMGDIVHQDPVPGDTSFMKKGANAMVKMGVILGDNELSSFLLKNVLATLGKQKFSLNSDYEDTKFFIEKMIGIINENGLSNHGAMTLLKNVTEGELRVIIGEHSERGKSVTDVFQLLQNLFGTKSGGEGAERELSKLLATKCEPSKLALTLLLIRRACEKIYEGEISPVKKLAWARDYSTVKMKEYIKRHYSLTYANVIEDAFIAAQTSHSIRVAQGLTRDDFAEDEVYANCAIDYLEKKSGERLRDIKYKEHGDYEEPVQQQSKQKHFNQKHHGKRNIEVFAVQGENMGQNQNNSGGNYQPKRNKEANGQAAMAQGENYNNNGGGQYQQNFHNQNQGGNPNYQGGYNRNNYNGNGKAPPPKHCALCDKEGHLKEDCVKYTNKEISNRKCRFCGGFHIQWCADGPLPKPASYGGFRYKGGQGMVQGHQQGGQNFQQNQNYNNQNYNGNQGNRNFQNSNGGGNKNQNGSNQSGRGSQNSNWRDPAQQGANVQGQAQNGPVLNLNHGIGNNGVQPKPVLDGPLANRTKAI